VLSSPEGGLPNRRFTGKAEALSNVATRDSPAFLLALLFAAARIASAGESVLADISHSSWTGRDGSPQGINALAQTTDGYLWIGTSSGLYRFDGLRFRPFVAPSTGPQFSSLDIVALAADAQNGLWMGFRVGGVSYLRAGRLTNYDDRTGLIMSFVQQILPRDGEGVWAVTAGRLMQLTGSRWRDFGSEHGLPIGTLQSVFIDRSGDMWVGADHAIYFLAKGKSEFILTAETVKTVTQFAQAPGGAVWISDGWTSIRPIGGEAHPAPALRLRGVSNFLFDSHGNLWNANDYFGLDVTSAKDLGGNPPNSSEIESEHFDRSDGLTAKACRGILADREGNIWVGTEMGLDRFQHANFRPFKDAQLKSFPGLAAGINGGVWIASFGTPLLGVNSQQTTQYGEKRGWGPIYPDRNNVVWQYDYWRKELSTFDGKTFTHVEVPQELDKKVVQSITGNSSGDIFVSFENDGIWRIHDRQWEQISRPGTPSKLALSLIADSSGRLWAGFPNGKVSMFEGGKLRVFDDGGLTDLGSVMTFCESRGQIWAGGTNGVVFFRGTGFQRLTVAEGTLLRGVSGIVQTVAGDLWLNSASGIVRIDSSEIDRFLDQSGYRIQGEILDFRDGVRGTPAQLRPTPTAIADSTGRLWFATEGSVVSVDPAVFKTQRPLPLVLVESVRSGGIERTIEPQKEISVKSKNLEINYVGISLTSPQRVTYRYKLEGEDTQWQQAGTRRQALYTSLAPGRYRFHVSASVGDGRWKDFDFPADLIVPRAFYETTWFAAVCLMLILAALLLLHELRVQQLTAKVQERLDARLTERARIARDLHDTLLQGVQGLIIRFHCAAEQIPRNDPARVLMDEALDSADTIMEEGRDSVRDLRADQLSIEELATELTRVGTSLNRRNDVHFGVSTEGSPATVHQIVGKELCMIGREAITNAFRHAGASRITVEINSDGSAVRLRCHDNGSGIHPDVLQGGKDGHWGLIGMRERAKNIGGVFECWSVPARGTEISVTAPVRDSKIRTSASFVSFVPLKIRTLFRRTQHLPR
jgi:signal transduction histidine kinase/ligand-binding sensor domain-containing protein